MKTSVIKVKHGIIEDFLEDFVNISMSIYHGDPNWIPTSIEEILASFGKEDPYLNRGERKVFIAYKNEVPSARLIASYDARSSSLFEQPTGFFSHFESINDKEVAHELFQAVYKWFQERKIVKILGPMTPKITDTRGFLLKGEGRPLYGMPYTKDYYIDLLQEIDFHKSMNMFEYIIKLDPPYKKLEKISKFVNRKFPKINIRSINLDDLYKEIDSIVKVYNNAWRENWGFIPIDTDEFYAAFKQILPYYKAEFCLMAEEDGECIGFQMIMPDLNNDTAKKVFRAFFIGVLPEYRNKGIESYLLSECLNRVAFHHNIDFIHVAWVLESNIKWRKEIEKIVGKENVDFKLYSVLEKNIEGQII